MAGTRAGRAFFIGLALAVLLALFGSAALAPLLASDRPLVLEAADYGAYERARRELSLPVRSMIQHLEAGPGADGYEAALTAERDAARLRITTMRTYLERGADSLLLAVDAGLSDALASASAGDLPGALRTAHEALSAARLAEASLVARPPGFGADPEVVGAFANDPRAVSLKRVRTYPLLASLTVLDAFCALLFVGALATLGGWGRLFRPRERAGPATAGPAARRAVLGALGLAALGALAFAALRPEAAPRGWKAALTAGELDVARVVYPPLFYAYDETHLDEALRPPSWLAPAEAEPGDLERGATPGSAAIERRAGEPPVDSPWRHPLGTDGLGRDLLARMLWGGRVSLVVGVVSAALVLLIGVLAGGLAGYHGGWIDRGISRVIEVVQCFPAFFLIVTVVALIPDQRLHPLLAVVGVIALVHWTSIARLVRAEFLRARELDYVAAARAQGLAPGRIIFGHVLPNVLGPVLVAGAFAVASGLLIESGVSFLGFGVRHPIPSWGALLSESRSLEHWWLQIFPGLVIFATVLSIHVLGDALRVASDVPEGSDLHRGGALAR